MLSVTVEEADLVADVRAPVGRSWVSALGAKWVEDGKVVMGPACAGRDVPQF